MVNDTSIDLREIGGLVLETAADPIFVMDMRGRALFANPAAETTFGWTQDEMRGRVLHDLIHHRHPDGRPDPMCECPLGAVFTSLEPLRKHEDTFFHRDGRPVRVACSNAPILRGGIAVGTVLVAVDITERIKLEERLRLLTEELTHRVKNSLAMAQSLVGNALRGVEGIEAIRADVDSRLAALGAAHDLLLRGSWAGASIRSVAEEILAPYRRVDTLVIDGPHVELASQEALMLGMALHELATNASKYGALSTPQGAVRLDWSLDALDGSSRLVLRWKEKHGPPVVPPDTSGFGTHLVRQVASALGGSVSFDYAAEGLSCVLEAPRSAGDVPVS